MWKRKLFKKQREIFKSKLFLRLFLLVFFLFAVYVGVFIYIRHKESIYLSPISIDPAAYSKFQSQKIASPSSQTISVEKLLSQNQIPYSSVTLGSQSAILVHLQTGEEVVLSSKKSLSSQVSSLQLVLSRFTIEGKKFTHLDFRFDRPVVVFR